MEGDHAAVMVVRESAPTGAPKPKLLDQVRQRIRARHYSRRTEKAYVHWIKRYIYGEPALNALLFLYREVLGVDLPWLEQSNGWSKSRRS
jgi:hypothetical protein